MKLQCLDSGVVFASDVKNIPLTIEVVTQTKPIRSVIVANHLGLYSGVQIMEEDDDGQLYLIEARLPAGLIAMYRIALLTHAENRLNKEMIAEDAKYILKKDDQCLQHIRERMNSDTIADILKSAPSATDLAKAIHFVQSHGIAVDLEEIEHEVRIGNVVLSQTLKAANVFTPEERQADSKRINELLEPFEVHIKAFTKGKSEFAAVIRKGVLKALSRGIKDPAIVLGIAMLQQFLEDEDLPAGAQSLIESIGESQLGPTSVWLMQRFESQKTPRNRRDVTYYISTLRDVMTHWGSLHVNPL